MWFIVKILWTWNQFFTLLEISKPLFFFPFSAMPLSQLLKKKLFPYFGNDIAVIAIFYFKSTPHSGTLGRTGLGKLGSGISAMPLPKFSLSPHIPNYLWTVRITQINFEFYNINPKDSENMIKSYRQNEYLFTLTVYMLAILHKVIKEEQV